MIEKILKALMRLFAIIGAADENPVNARSIVVHYLKQFLNHDQVEVYIALYDEILAKQAEGGDGEKKRRRLAVSSVKVIVICEQINEELTQKQKFVVLINLIEFVNYNKIISEQELAFLETVSASFNFSELEFKSCLSLATLTDVAGLENEAHYLSIGKEPLGDKPFVKYFHAEGVEGNLLVFQVESIGIYVLRYFGKASLLLNGQPLRPHHLGLFAPGSSIRSSKVSPIYYSDVVSMYMKSSETPTFTFEVAGLEYFFKGGKQGLHPLTFKEDAGKLIGIMGGSGAGKSTLLNVLNGNNNPSKGSVLINGFNLHQDKKQLEGVVGFIPQDDLLIEELTVYQNLYYNVKLCFDGMDADALEAKVKLVLSDLGLLEAMHLKVGNPLEQTISGGQRKRLNIALELIREPSVLFVDEPTSGLSSRDSENIMDLLKELALKGKLIFVVIHQPSSDIFKIFDKLLLLDVGGYPIYYGNPVESVVYFKRRMNQVNADESECLSCGNVNPEQIFNIIESKVLDENGNPTSTRRVSAKEWNGYYLERFQTTEGSKTGLDEGNKGRIKEAKPIATEAHFKKPNPWKQLLVFLQRDVRSKIANKQYLSITLLEAPVLGLILSFLIKYYNAEKGYTFAGNKNLPAYLFMCVLVGLFIGLTVSAEEIIRDRKILKRESFLNLSRASYLWSKIILLFFISGIQTLSFVLIGNAILGIQGMFLSYWLVLFTSSCFANMLGLNISSAFNSAVTIYILIPFLLIPQILLSGVIVKFEELNPRISSSAVVPIWGDAMASRWAFEALAVNQFVNNAYEKEVYPLEKKIANAGFKKMHWFAKMNDLLAQSKQGGNAAIECAALLRQELQSELLANPAVPMQTDVHDYLLAIKKHYAGIYETATREKDAWNAKFQETEQGKIMYAQLLNANQNKKLEDFVKNADSDLDPIIYADGHLISTSNPIYFDGTSRHIIRAHFLAPSKNLFGHQIPTFWANLLVIWVMTLLLAITLYTEALRKLLKLFA